MLSRGGVATAIVLSPLGIHQVFFPDAVDGDLAITLLGSFAGFAIPFFFLVLIASLTKHYRTVGVKAPFVLAILTPALPFMLAQFTNRMHGSAIAVARQARGEAFSS